MLMMIRLKTLIFIFFISANVFSGTPLKSGINLKSEVCRSIKYCEEKVKSCKPEQENAKYLCCILVGSRNIPTNTISTFQIDLTPVLIELEKSTSFESLFSTPARKVGGEDFESSIRLINPIPKYIQHQKFLI